MSKEEELNLDKNRKKFDIREEYFVAFGFSFSLVTCILTGTCICSTAVKCCSRWGLGAKAHPATQRPARLGCPSYRTSNESALKLTLIRSSFNLHFFWRRLPQSDVIQTLLRIQGNEWWGADFNSGRDKMSLTDGILFLPNNPFLPITTTTNLRGTSPKARGKHAFDNFLA